MIQWSIGELANLEPTTAVEGVALLPAAPAPLRQGPAVELADFAIIDGGLRYRRSIAYHARFGDPRVEPAPYSYRLPYPHGMQFAVLQGFHGLFSHRGSNEFAVDFDCPVATPVVATRPGVVVATNAAAQGSGTTPDYLEYRRTNFVIVQHDDGSLGEYMHLSPSGVEVKPGQHVTRGQELALSGNTGFSSTPHLHFQVMTAAEDGVAARSFPFEIAVGPGRIEEPVQGRTYLAWE
jgi:murein DD-endopeptidase MepM/ murein hydrolase activator NlpD